MRLCDCSATSAAFFWASTAFFSETTCCITWMRALFRLASASRSLASATRISGLLRRAVASSSSRLPAGGFATGAVLGASLLGVVAFGGDDPPGGAAPGVVGWAQTGQAIKPASMVSTLILMLRIFFLLLAIEFQRHG